MVEMRTMKAVRTTRTILRPIRVVRYKGVRGPAGVKSIHIYDSNRPNIPYFTLLLVYLASDRWTN